MNARTLILAVAALLVTAGTVFFVRAWMDSQRQVAAPTPEKPAQTEVLVAAIDVPTGQFLNEKHVRWQVWPEGSVQASYYVKHEGGVPKDLFGAVLRRGISAGEPFTEGRVVRPGERGFLAAVLRPGFRAIAVPVSAKLGVGGLVFPGDRVDLILSHSVSPKEGEGGGGPLVVSETVLTNVRVLAIDQRTDDQNSQPKVAKTATLEVTPKQVEMIAVVEQLGQLSLSLRSLAKDEQELDVLARTGEILQDPDPTRGTSYTVDTQVSRVVGIRKKRQKDQVLVTRGGESAKVEFERQ